MASDRQMLRGSFAVAVLFSSCGPDSDSTEVFLDDDCLPGASCLSSEPEEGVLVESDALDAEHQREDSGDGTGQLRQAVTSAASLLQVSRMRGASLVAG